MPYVTYLIDAAVLGPRDAALMLLRRSSMKRYLCVVLIGFFGFVCQSHAGVISQLTLTESSTMLNWQWAGGTGGTLPLNSVDNWSGTISAPPPGETFPDPTSLSGNWIEPENTGTHNSAGLMLMNGTWTLSVGSDVPGPGSIPDGQSVSSAFVSIQFIDNAQRTEVPDSGSTSVLLGFGLGCVGLARATIKGRTLQLNG
jgi:hypothetical protein